MKINIKKLEKERLKLGLNKTELSRLVGIGYYAYQAIIRKGSTKLTTLNRIAKALKVDTKDLLT